MHTTETTNALAGIHPDDIVEDYERRALDETSDAELFDDAASLISRPKIEPADSFILHAPLELLARFALLPAVDPARRQRARQRLVWIAASYERAGVSAAPASDEPLDLHRAITDLPLAIGGGDLDATDACARAVGALGTPAEVLRLTDGVVSSLAAAAHAGIFLYQLPRVAPRSRAAIAMLRPLARELARYPDWQLQWTDQVRVGATTTGRDVVEGLLATPHLGSPGSDFIFPLMHQVDGDTIDASLAAQVVSPLLGATTDPAAFARALARTAALSMLLDAPSSAPYGWSHCLTMPQAVAALAPCSLDPTRTLAIAATYTVGFRTALGSPAIAPAYEPDDPDVDWRDALDAAAEVAAAAVHHAPNDADHDIVTELASRAAIHPDAHLAKYTLACFDAAAADPAHRRLHLSAAAYLHGWWNAVPTDDPLVS